MTASPFITTEEAAAFLRFERADGTPDRKRFLNFCYAHDVPRYKRGATVLVDRQELEAIVRRNLLTPAR